MPLLVEKGSVLIDNGYQVVPILPNKKYPGVRGWEQLNTTKDDLTKYASNGYARGGVGVLAKHTPGIDIDILDSSIVDQVVDHVGGMLGEIMLRVGLPPKTLIPCQCNEPFTKVSSRVWVDFLGDRHKLEILGDGQQWVAYGMHPDTGEPYQWGDGGVTSVPREELPVLDHTMAVEMVEWFEGQCPGWG